MADDFYGYDRWRTTPPDDDTEPMTFVICKHGHHRMTRDPDSPCPECAAPWRAVVGILPKKASTA